MKPTGIDRSKKAKLVFSPPELDLTCVVQIKSAGKPVTVLLVMVVVIVVSNPPSQFTANKIKRQKSPSINKLENC